jgi:hypothetical protein
MGGDDTVEGLTLERFTEMSVALYDKTPEQQETIAQSFGVSPGHLQAVIDGWTARMSDPQTLHRYNELYQKELGEAGVQRPDVPLEQYAAMMKAMGTGTSAQEVCAQNGMTVQQWALVAQHWGQRMMADPSLAVRFAELMGYMGPASSH